MFANSFIYNSLTNLRGIRIHVFNQYLPASFAGILFLFWVHLIIEIFICLKVISNQAFISECLFNKLIIYFVLVNPVCLMFIRPASYPNLCFFLNTIFFSLV